MILSSKQALDLIELLSRIEGAAWEKLPNHILDAMTENVDVLRAGVLRGDLMNIDKNGKASLIDYE